MILKYPEFFPLANKTVLALLFTMDFAREGVRNPFNTEKYSIWVEDIYRSLADEDDKKLSITETDIIYSIRNN